LGHRRYPLFDGFDGGGAFKYGSRWCSPGRYLVHTAYTYSLAVLENLVHWQMTALPPEQQYVEARIPARVSREVLGRDELSGWDDFPYGPSQSFGDRWYDEQRTAVLVVPSVLSPFEPNVLLNQRHPEFARVTASDPASAVLDQRLFRRASSV
jgi:RES domain-containing protein